MSQIRNAHIEGTIYRGLKALKVHPTNVESLLSHLWQGGDYGNMWIAPEGDFKAGTSHWYSETPSIQDLPNYNGEKHIYFGVAPTDNKRVVFDNLKGDQ